MRTLTVDLGDRSYPIYIGSGLVGDAALYRPHIHGRQVMVVTNETVAPLYLARVREALDGWDVADVVLPDGEQFKTLGVFHVFQGSFKISELCDKVALALKRRFRIGSSDRLPTVGV